MILKFPSEGWDYVDYVFLCMIVKIKERVMAIAQPLWLIMAPNQKIEKQ